MTIDDWEHSTPLLKTLPVDWDYTIPFGLLHSPEPSSTVGRFLDAVKTVLDCHSVKEPMRSMGFGVYP